MIQTVTKFSFYGFSLIINAIIYSNNIVMTILPGVLHCLGSNIFVTLLFISQFDH